MNRHQRLREVIRVCRGGQVARPAAPPDWAEWGRCHECGADPGQSCVDVFGTARAPRTVDRLNPHPSRVPIPSQRTEAGQ
jgi:hypothetical protein